MTPRERAEEYVNTNELTDDDDGYTYASDEAAIARNAYLAGFRAAIELAATKAKQEEYCYDAGCFDIQDTLKANIAISIEKLGEEG